MSVLINETPELFFNLLTVILLIPVLKEHAVRIYLLFYLFLLLLILFLLDSNLVVSELPLLVGEMRILLTLRAMLEVAMLVASNDSAFAAVFIPLHHKIGMLWRPGVLWEPLPAFVILVIIVTILEIKL